MKPQTKRRVTRAIIIICAIVFSLSLSAIPSDTLISLIGSENAYVIMYFIAFMGSISTFASIPYPLFILSFVAGGFDPLYIGIASAFGVITADSITFILVKRGKSLLSQKIKNSIETISEKVKKHPRLLTPGLIAYGTFAPLSNDFVVISFAAMRYHYFRIIPALALGNIIYNIAIAFSADLLPFI